MPVPSQESDHEQSCICVLGVSISPLTTIFPLVFGTVPTVCYFLFFSLLPHNYREWKVCGQTLIYETLVLNQMWHKNYLKLELIKKTFRKHGQMEVHAVYKCTKIYRDMQKVVGYCNFLLYIFHIKPHFFKTLSQSQFLFDKNTIKIKLSVLV